MQLERPDPAAHAKLVERLREALEAQDRAGLMRLFSSGADVLSDAPQRVNEPVATTNPLDTAALLSGRASCAEAVSIDGTPGIALLDDDSEIAMLIDVSTDGGAIVALRIVTRAAHLQAANRRFGRAAVKRLITRIQMRTRFARAPSVAMGGDFPVDVDA